MYRLCHDSQQQQGIAAFIRPFTRMHTEPISRVLDVGCCGSTRSTKAIGSYRWVLPVSYYYYLVLRSWAVDASKTIQSQCCLWKETRKENGGNLSLLLRGEVKEER